MYTNQLCQNIRNADLELSVAREALFDHALMLEREVTELKSRNNQLVDQVNRLEDDQRESNDIVDRWIQARNLWRKTAVKLTSQVEQMTKEIAANTKKEKAAGQVLHSMGINKVISGDGTYIVMKDGSLWKDDDLPF